MPQVAVNLTHCASSQTLRCMLQNELPQKQQLKIQQTQVESKTDAWEHLKKTVLLPMNDQPQIMVRHQLHSHHTLTCLPLGFHKMGHHALETSVAVP